MSECGCAVGSPRRPRPWGRLGCDETVGPSPIADRAARQQVDESPRDGRRRKNLQDYAGCPRTGRRHSAALATGVSVTVWRAMRLFVAVWPPPGAVDELGRALVDVRAAVPQLRWTIPEQWHVTLAFLGEVADDRRPELERRLARVAARHPP